MIDKLTVLNPFAKLPDEEAASRAARAGAVGAWLTALGSAVGAVTLYLRIDVFVAEMNRQMALSAASQPNAEATQALMSAMGPGIAWTTIIVSVIIALAYVLFGFIQWRKKTRFIPLLMLLFAAYGLLAMLTGLANAKASSALTSPLQLGFSLVISVLALLCFTAGLRGGYRLHVLKQAA
ncbi:hypothetical protein [Caulobacter hibisci]|uniref:Uncharacterized protein n=1 Tax=Caulobacter hibisci TaxID=2035993 RepID=A0ABS0SRH3_9CAUL|nr:hypothetical protein [Caulobacter hibisci]MBI1682205.1 hypothetical protein [Caulobacter hibisci]